VDKPFQERQEKPAANSRLPQWGLTWLNQVQCFYQHLCLVDREKCSEIPTAASGKTLCVIFKAKLHKQKWQFLK
jgi:hypothetical protein